MQNDINGKFDPVKTTLASLYEPYTGEYFITPLLDMEYRPLFQPGFDYTFLGCCCNYPEPADYDDTSFSVSTNVLKSISKYETNFNEITHPNHSAIRINFPVSGLEKNKPRKCYDNWYSKAKSGKITHFKDGVFNTNVNIVYKDSIGINNPNLIEDLQPGLYKIEKTYVDGAVKDQTIYKN